MILTSVTVRNFRCIKELTVELDQLTVLVGENNTGKTAFLEAIRICLERLRGRSRTVFHEYDYRLGSEDATPASADPIEIELFFQEPEPETWSEEIIREMSTVLSLKGDRYQLTFRLASSFDAAAGEFILDWSFLDADGNELTGAAKNVTHLTSLQRICPAFYLSALRDAAEHFAARGRYWRTFLSESAIQDKDRRELEIGKSGEYRTKRFILEIYYEMAEAIRTGKPCETRLDPPPADPRCCHPPRQLEQLES